MKAFHARGLELFNAQLQGNNIEKIDEAKNITQLSLSSAAISNELISEKLSKLTHLSRLTLVDMRINDAQLPFLFDALKTSGANKTLRALDMCDNKITSFVDAAAVTFPALARLVLCGNKIATVDALGLTAARFPSLRTLDVDQNDCADAAGGNDANGAWARLPSLVVVNGNNRSGEEYHDPSDDDDDGDDEEGDEEDSDFVADEEEEDEEEDDDNESGDGESNVVDTASGSAGQRRERED